MPDLIPDPPAPQRTWREYAGCAALMAGVAVVGVLIGLGLWTLVRFFQEVL